MSTFDKAENGNLNFEESPAPDWRHDFDPEKLWALTIQFLDCLDESSIRTLCSGGSIWIDREDVLNSRVNLSSFHVLGWAQCGFTRQNAWRLEAELMFDMEGMAEHFIFDGDVDENDQPVQPSENVVMYSTELGLQKMKSELEFSFDGFDGLLNHLEGY